MYPEDFYFALFCTGERVLATLSNGNYEMMPIRL
jgi:hypothetical protein